MSFFLQSLPQQAKNPKGEAALDLPAQDGGFRLQAEPAAAKDDRKRIQDGERVPVQD
jgi:hypothetical protein